ncbi:hypothetical protein H072_3105 [Dactylellina haptotyla CBS 200.50]|uniref:Fungal N-terminal domain-containing protein n=1 Tax=Dactylellina haptotyla (strain CBS 200.50) TaxID=1284197 RepID=S8ANV9_DACHA|nr:hypothetical protein H072_3105 [Dactylellina haptotyla CBS 200.50]
MDPLSIAASVAGLLGLCIQIGQTVGTLADALENVDNTISSFRGEIAALSGVLKSISSAFSDPKRHRILEEEVGCETGHIGQYWKGVVVSLEHCDATLRKMSRVLDGVQTSRRTRIFRSFGKHLKLTSEEGVLTLYRQEVQSHTANLQISLQMISVCLSLASDDSNADASVRLDDLSDDVRNIYRLLDRTRSDLPEPQAGDAAGQALISSSRTVVDDLKTCLGAAELLISDASTHAEKQSVRESAAAASEFFSPAQRRRVQDWINAPTVDAVSEALSDGNDKAATLDVRSMVGAHATSPVVDKFRPELAVQTEETSIYDEVLSESSDIDSDFKTHLYTAGLQYFEQKDYTRAERFFTKAIQANGDDGGKSTDKNMLKVKFYLAQTLCKQRKWDDSLALLTTLQSVLPTEDSLKCMEASILHELAVVYFGKGYTPKAKEHAKKAASRRRKIHGKKDARFYESIGLLADICQSLGDPEDAEAYRAFIPKACSHRYTDNHVGIPGQNVDEKEVVLQPTSNDIGDGSEEEEPIGPLVPSLSRSASSSLPSTSVSRSTSFASRVASSPMTQYSDFNPFRNTNRVASDSYIPPRVNTFELESFGLAGQSPDATFDPLAKTISENNADEDGQTPFTKEFLEVFRKVGQYQMLGWKDKAAKIAIAYYRTFSENGKYKLVSRYMDDIAWRCLERNILEGLSSLSSTGQGFSAIHFFSLLGVPSVVGFLLDRKAEISAKAAQIFGYTQGNGERKRGKLSGLARSLSRSSIGSISTLPDANWTPLHFAAAYSGDPETIRLLLEKGGQLEEKAGRGYTPLLLATRKAALDMERYLDHSMDLAAIAILVGNGAKVDAVDDDGLGINAHAHCMKTGDLANYLFSLSVS